MISPQLLERSTLFSDLSKEHIAKLAAVAEEAQLDAGGYFFHEDDVLDYFYIVLAGVVGIVIEHDEMHRENVVSQIGIGHGFGWSAFFKPHIALFGAKSLVPCRVLAFDFRALRQAFATDPAFAYALTQKAGQGMRDRLHALWKQQSMTRGA